MQNNFTGCMYSTQGEMICKAKKDVVVPPKKVEHFKASAPPPQTVPSCNYTSGKCIQINGCKC